MPKDLILPIEQLNGSSYQCTALASLNRYRKRYELTEISLIFMEEMKKYLQLQFHARHLQVHY